MPRPDGKESTEKGEVVAADLRRVKPIPLATHHSPVCGETIAAGLPTFGKNAKQIGKFRGGVKAKFGAAFAWHIRCGCDCDSRDARVVAVAPFAPFTPCRELFESASASLSAERPMSTMREDGKNGRCFLVLQLVDSTQISQTRKEGMLG